MEKTFGDAFTKIPMSKTATGSKFRDEFDNVKKTFNGKDMNKQYQLHLPALGKNLKERKVSPTSYDFGEFNVLVSGHDIARMFEPVIEKAFASLDQQRLALQKEKKQPFKVLCLCGGLGNSEYIWKRFDEYCQKKLKNQCQLVTDERAWSSVTRGAAVRGIDGSMVLSKKAKRCYGIGVHQTFQEGADEEEDSFMCPLKGKRAGGYIDWTVKRGRKFTPGFKAESKVYVAVQAEVDPEDLVFTWDLYSCATVEAPIKIDGPGVEKIAKIHLNLGDTYKPEGLGTEPANIKIVMKLGSDRGVLLVEALHNRTVVGQAKIDYTKDHVRKATQTPGLI